MDNGSIFFMLRAWLQNQKICIMGQDAKVYGTNCPFYADIIILTFRHWIKHIRVCDKNIAGFLIIPAEYYKMADGFSFYII